MRIYVNPSTNAYIYSHIYICTHSYAYTQLYNIHNTHKHNTYMHTHTLSYIHTSTHIHVYIHVLHKQRHAHTYKCTHHRDRAFVNAIVKVQGREAEDEGIKGARHSVVLGGTQQAGGEIKGMGCRRDGLRRVKRRLDASILEELRPKCPAEIGGVKEQSREEEAGKDPWEGQS